MSQLFKCAMSAALGMLIGSLITHQWDFLWGELVGMGLFIVVWRYIWHEGQGLR